MAAQGLGRRRGDERPAVSRTDDRVLEREEPQRIDTRRQAPVLVPGDGDMVAVVGPGNAREGEPFRVDVCGIHLTAVVVERVADEQGKAVGVAVHAHRRPRADHPDAGEGAVPRLVDRRAGKLGEQAADVRQEPFTPVRILVDDECEVGHGAAVS